jgi:hypothetical protein
MHKPGLLFSFGWNTRSQEAGYEGNGAIERIIINNQLMHGVCRVREMVHP